MTRKKYGQTYWGEQWLDALEKLDEKKRLEAGQVYADKGTVRQLKIKKNEVSAQVQITPSSYHQILEFPKFSATNKKKLLDLLASDSSLLSKLLNRQLPAELLALIEENKIKLFLKDWGVLNMACSCSDWTLPCKHLAAVIYMLAREIDQNPFLVFELRGLDLIGELKKRGIAIGKQSKESIPELIDFTQDGKTINLFTIEAYKQLDFSGIENQHKTLFQLLNDKPVFYSKDFKAQLKLAYAQTANEYLRRRSFERGTYLHYHRAFQAANELVLVVDSNGLLFNVFDIKEKTQQAIFPKGLEIKTLIGTLETIAEGTLINYPDHFIALLSVYQFAMKLLRERSYIPRLFRGKGGCSVQWIPSHMDKMIRWQLEKLSQLCPTDLLLLDNDGELEFFSPTEQIQNLCSLFIAYYMQQANISLPERGNRDKKIRYCFFGEGPARFDEAGEKEIPNSIQLWLNKFYLSQKHYVPILQVEEAEEQFYIIVLVEDKKGDELEPIGLLDFLNQKKYAAYKYDLLKDLSQLSHYLPVLSTMLKEGKESTTYYDGAMFSEVFFEILPILQLLGINILLPRSLRRLTRPKLAFKVKKKEEEEEQKGEVVTKSKSFMNVKAMLGFQWQIAIGNELLSADEFMQLVRGRSGLVKFKDFYIHINHEDLQALMRRLEKPPKISANALLQAALSQSYEGDFVSISPAAQQLLQEVRKVKEIAPPKGLQATLRPYQLIGYSWMYKNTELGMGSLIADDMGLGKTLQIIALLLKFKEEGRLDDKQALVIVPTSLLTNWIKEIRKFAPALQAAMFHGNKRRMPEVEVIITTYGLVRTELEKFKKRQLYCTIIDEAQNIKNANTTQTKAVKAIPADFHIAMSGTPVENRLSEYWSIMDFVNEGYLGSLSKFKETFANPIQNENNLQRLDTFLQITAPFILRRLKSDKSIIQDLPKKIENNYYAGLEDDQTAIYQNVVNNTVEQMANEEDQKAKQGLILKLMGSLKQICNHPFQYLKKGARTANLSGKAQLLFSLLDNIYAQGEKVLIFTQFKLMGDLLSEWIAERYGRTPLFLHGGCSREQRDQMVVAFQTQRNERAFVLSLKAAGTGLTLTAANHVIHYDLWWNPAVESQATDRAYRIGQQKNVMVYRLIVRGTLEEKIDEMIQGKKELADMTVSLGSKWIGDLSDAELKDLLSLEID